MIASLFILTLVLGVVGLYLYYSSLAPLRLVEGCSGISSVLDHVKYMEYNITDQEGNVYLVKLSNNPGNRTGKIEFYINGELNATVTYKYGSKLEYIHIEYSNGTNITAKGINATAYYEEPFATSLVFKYNETAAQPTPTPGGQAQTVEIHPFPGIAPVYMHCFLGKALQIDWRQYAGLIKPRNQTPGIVNVYVSFGKTNFSGTQINSLILSISRRLSISGKWSIPVYNMVVAKIDSVPAIITMVVDVRTPENPVTYTFHLIKLEPAS